MWQNLRDELHPRGLEIVNVALDTDVDAATVVIEAVSPTHPSLIDPAHRTAEIFGTTNVPSGVWIDEEGVIVRPPETAWATDRHFGETKVPEGTPEETVRLIEEARKLKTESALYLSAVRNWVVNGHKSRYVLEESEVIERSSDRSSEKGQAAANFEMAQHLHRSGERERAITFFREAHRLAPDDWTYKRQAWSLNGSQGPTDTYDGYFAKDLIERGAENFYPALRM